MDLVIRGGTLLDGTGVAPRIADVGVKEGRIAAIGKLPANGAEVDATGLTVAPGFIDIHSHSDYTLLVDPRAVSAIAQGVTLEVIGNCGFGCAPIRDPQMAAPNIYGFNGSVPLQWTRVGQYLDRLEAAQPAVNVITLVPNGQLRRATLGVADRAANGDELAAMKRLLEEGLADGAWGYSTGLEYPAERGAPDEELTELCKVVAKRGGLYASHTRRRDEGAVSAIDEAIRVGERAGAQIQISHLLPRKTDEREDHRSLELIDQARGRGLDIAFDMHTRDHPKFPQYSRRSFGDLARAEGRDAYDIAFDILAADLDQPPASQAPPMVIIHAYTPDQQALMFSHPLCMPGSDATTLAPDGPLANSVFHGAYTWASWYFHFMVHERRLLKAEEAVQRLTQLPAKRLGLRDRGTIAEGCREDIAVFDAERFQASASTFEPNQLAQGMRHVVVNGVVTLREGRLTGSRGGQVLRRNH
ncbi:MAG: amidohydrolase family protein [Betaproteobacteria bacterium]|nr:amidohydrolase family protein [Betaproteobacteria bacterium]